MPEGEIGPSDKACLEKSQVSTGGHGEEKKAERKSTLLSLV